MSKSENIALFDMDGTICDYDRGLFEGLEKLRAPEELIYRHSIRDDSPEYIRNRADLIRASESWWENLPRLQLGWNILEIAKKLDYRIMILTQGPRKNPASWSGKKKWIDKNLGQEVDITITRDKGLVYGKVLVDDYPKYIERWLQWRERGLVIMPANESNKYFNQKQVIRYDGTNLEEVSKAMERVKLKKENT